MKLILIAGTPDACDRLRERAERSLPRGTALVRIVETVAPTTRTCVIPEDPEAEVIAREPPLLLPGGVTVLASHVRVRLDRRGATEYRVHASRLVSSRAIALSPECVGQAEAPADPGVPR